MALRTVGVRLMADVSNYTTNMGKASLTTKNFSESLNQKASAGKLDAIADRAGVMGVGLAAGFGYAVKAAADFDKQMSAVSAATHASTGELSQLRAAALQAGKDTQYSATEAAKGITELSKAGVSTADVLNGGLKGALSLAAAGQIDVGQAAETAASAMTQFKLSGDKIPHVADLLAAGAGKAQGSVADMSAALNQAGLIASQTGLTIEDTTGTLAAFASAGLTGSDAGTSFKTMLQALQAPSAKTKDLMDNLGISAYDANGAFVGITGLAGQLKDKLSKLTPELRANALAQIFGSDATRAASVLYAQGAEGIQKWIDKTNDAGYASETAAKLTDNLAGDLERLKGSLETMAIEGGSGANSGLRVITKSLGAMVDQFGELPPVVGGTITVLTGLTAAVLLSGVAWVKYRSFMAKVNAELIATGPAGEKAAAGLSKASKAAGIAGAAFLGLEVVGAVFDHFGPAAANVDKLTESLENFSNTGKVSGELADTFGADLSGLNISATTAVSGLSGFTGAVNDLGNTIGVSPISDWLQSFTGTTSINKATEDMAAYDAALTQVMTTSGDAKKASDLWNGALQRSGLDTGELAKVLPDAYKKVGELNNQAMQAGGAVGSLGAAEDGTAAKSAALTKQMEQQKAEADSLEKSVEALFKQYMTADQAQIALRETVKSTNKEFRSGSHTLSLNTDEGRKNRSAVLDRLSAIEDMREAEIKNTGKVDEANKKYRDQVGDLKRTLKQMGFNRTEIGKLINKYDDVPGEVKTKVSVTGLNGVVTQLVGLTKVQQALKKGTALPGNYRRAFAGYDKGGWTGPGDTHDVAGVVHADEYVINKSSRQKIERRSPGLLDEMNATGQAPGYARGGRVTYPFPVTAAMTRIPSAKEVANAVTPDFGNWPSSPGAQRGDSGVWRRIVALIRSTGPMSGSFGNAYRPGDPKWHGSGRAVDWMGFNQDGLASFLAAKRPLELIHRTSHRDYAYTRGVNKGSFNNSLMQAHRNHVHIAMNNGGTIREPVMGVGASGRTYSFGENYQPETVTPNWQSEGGRSGGGAQLNITFSGPVGSQYELETWLTGAVDKLKKRGRI